MLTTVKPQEKRLACRRRLTSRELGKELFGRARSGRSDLSSLRVRELAGAARGKRVRG